MKTISNKIEQRALSAQSVNPTKTSRYLSLAFALGFGAASGSAAAALFVVDGINTPGADDYAPSFQLKTAFDSGFEAFANVSLGRGTEGSQTDHLFMLFEMPTEIIDLTFGVNSSPGWDGRTAVTGHDHPVGGNHGEFDADGNYKDGGEDGVHSIGSEKIEFKLGGKEVKVKMKFDGDKGYKLEKNGEGLVIGASTSLDYNLIRDDGAGGTTGYLNPNLSYQDSPGGDACKANTGAAGDADCYASIPSDYQYVQSYELEIDILEIDGDFFDGNWKDNLLSLITDIESHASVPKRCLNNVTFYFNSDKTDDCDPTTPPDPPVSVPEPGILFLFGIGLAGLGFTCRRKKA